VFLQTSVIAGVLAGMCFASVVIWAGFGVAIGRFLGRPRARTAFNWTMASLLYFLCYQCSCNHQGVLLKFLKCPR
jgi:threonine/homoserine/homoserine lactone efflux protein